MGGTKPWPEVPVGNADHTSAAVVIIGGGISGICTAIDLQKRGIQNFVILEKSSSFGGTWHDNKYPGCCCDVWSLLYSFSFEQNPNWSREYPGQEEILTYLLEVASKYNLYKHIRFNSDVESCTWDDVTKQWRTAVRVPKGTKDSEFEGDYTIVSDFLVSAVGQLNVPKYPDIKGLDQYKGKLMHSARWDWSYDLRGKKVALIGNGATAAQIAPEIAKVASHLTIFQRTPNWIVPRLDADVSTLRRTLQTWFPPFMWRIRAAMMDFRESTFEAIVQPKSDMAQMFKDLCLAGMHTALPGQEDMWKKLTPNYAVGCKRILISDDYYPCLARDNVSLETRPISHITGSGISVKDTLTSDNTSSEDFDLIILATGFRTVEFMHPISIKGANGRSLSDVWSSGAQAYLGVTIPSIPNFGMLYGPNTNLGHNSIILMIESQSKYITTLASAVLEARNRDTKGTNSSVEKDTGHSESRVALAPKQAVVDEYNTTLQTKLSGSSFADSSCDSWYKDSATGRITNNWSGTVVEYQKAVDKVVWEDFEDGDKIVAMRGGQKEASIPRVREETYVSDRVLATMMGVGAIAVGVASWVLRNQRTFGRAIRT